ncbi:MAG: hypothetical protein QOI15_1602 [Pseudonocardiales bacterium]|nr:hypothetical protein [Pseudonocardiales bacterium]MDT4920700.1 hypothetical protein [Pseudonocardiales bacterium]
MTSRLLAAAGTLLLAATATACGSSGPGAPPAAVSKGLPALTSVPTTTSSSQPTAPGDGCQYATVDEVSAALGAMVTAEPGPPAPPFDAPSCLYATDTTPARQITVAVYTQDDLNAAGGRTAGTFMTAVKSGLAGVQPIDGLGDEAFSVGTAGTSVYVRAGTAVVHVTAGVGGTSETARLAVRTVAATVLGHL